jgi:hypothetical protein
MQNMVLVVCWFVAFSVHAVVLGQGNNAQLQDYLEKEMTRRILEIERWNNAKKLSLWAIPGKAPDGKHSINLNSLSVGDIGVVEAYETTVTSIIDSQNCILTLRKLNGVTVWLANYPTDGLYSDQQVRLVGPVQATSTKNYETVVGSRKDVIVLEFVSKDVFRKKVVPKYRTKDGSELQVELKSYSAGQFVFEDLAGKEVAKKPSDFEKNELVSLAKLALELENLNSERDWKYKDGKYKKGSSMRAQILEVKGANCTFVKIDGSGKQEKITSKRVQFDQEGQDLITAFDELQQFLSTKK